jgi:hypothetical protein
MKYGWRTIRKPLTVYKAFAMGGGRALSPVREFDWGALHIGSVLTAIWLDERDRSCAAGIHAATKAQAALDSRDQFEPLANVVWECVVPVGSRVHFSSCEDWYGSAPGAKIRAARMMLVRRYADYKKGAWKLCV